MNNLKSFVFKKSFVLISSVLLIFLLFSCSQNLDNDPILEEMSTEEVFLNKEIGKLVNNKIEFSLQEEEILDNYNSFLSQTTSNEYRGKTFKIVKDDEGYHLLRFFNDDESSSTIRLFLDKETGNIVPLGVLCRTKDCASSSGCDPNWLGTQCSKCKGGKGDCEATKGAVINDELSPF